MRPSDHRRGLLLSAMLARLDGLERRLAASESRERELRELRETHARSLNRAHRKIEALERLRFEPTRSGAAPERLDRRVPASEAAEAIGCDTRTIRRLIESGRLRGAALDLGAGRKHWSVEAADLERLLATGGSPAAPAAPDGAFPGVPRARNGG